MNKEIITNSSQSPSMSVLYIPIREITFSSVVFVGCGAGWYQAGSKFLFLSLFRCESCQLPRPLPSRWVCGKTCLLSADSIIDYTTCLCCVKALFYHYSEGDGDVSCADDPCGCSPDKRTARWGCLAALSCILPCLWCYWPLRGCKRAVEVCYARHSRQGCRCRPPQTTPEKRLLDSSPDF